MYTWCFTMMSEGDHHGQKYDVYVDQECGSRVWVKSRSRQTISNPPVVTTDTHMFIPLFTHVNHTMYLHFHPHLL